MAFVLLTFYPYTNFNTILSDACFFLLKHLKYFLIIRNKPNPHIKQPTDKKRNGRFLISRYN